MSNVFYFMVYGTLTEQGHIEFHIDEEIIGEYMVNRVYDNSEDEWVDYEEAEKGAATLDLLQKTLEKKLRNPQ